MDDLASLKQCVGFEWDAGNSEKNWNAHGVSMSECEQVLFNKPLILENDIKHSKIEKRYYTLGQTNTGRKLLVVFTVRKNLIRIISARDMNHKEHKIYEQTTSI
jgi:uncharacterized DUF497 family protein